jgi:hypothetical protein
MESTPNQYRNQDIGMHTGNNYRSLLITGGILFGITVLLILAYWYAALWNPRYIVLRGDDPVQPLSAEIPLAVMPVLPDELAAVYDGVREDQLAALETFAVTDIDEDKVAIPIDIAIDLMLEDGVPTWSAGE